MAFIIRTCDNEFFETAEVTHQSDGSISITVEGGRRLRLSVHYWTVIEGAADH